MKQLGKFITFEGIDGAGKSTHIAYVIDLIKQHDINVVSTREPGGTPLGESLRNLVLNEKMHLETEALLMFAARKENLAQVIEPALQRGDWVISDRFTDSSFAYQGGGRKLALEKLNALEQWVHPDLQPDLTLLFDVPLEVARERVDATRGQDKFEQEKADFFAAARAEYLRRAAEFPDRFQVIDSTRPIPDIRELLTRLISQLIARA